MKYCTNAYAQIIEMRCSVEGGRKGEKKKKQWLVFFVADKGKEVQKKFSVWECHRKMLILELADVFLELHDELNLYSMAAMAR